MQQRSRFLLLGTATLVLALVVLLPARVAYRWIAPPGVALAGIEGTIWHGQASEAGIAGVYLRNLDWRMQPLALVTGKVAYHVEADAASGFVNADVALGIGSRASFTDVKASVALDDLQAIIGMPGLSGIANLQVERLEIVDGLPTFADGVLEVANLRAPLIHRAPIGGFKAEFFTQDTGIVASVEDTDAVLELAGSLSLGNDRRYQFLGKVAPNDRTPADLRQQMTTFLGSADDRGQYDVRLEGRM